ncbi:MAG: bifunctional DNA-binding transcriptional regulator/O6-methylguanine-DNA methyltransferase Ada [Geminicoccaceae bacterium]
MTITTAQSGPLYATDNERWQAVLARDPDADGMFFTGVLTTGIYCRPSCPARHPKRENVRFFDLRRDAEAANLRPCKRCRPDRPSLAQERVRLVEEACRRIEEADEAPNLETLAATSGLSAHHFHRVFKAVTGLTPKTYAKARRAEKAKDTLKTSRNVTEAIYDSGYASSGRFYDDASADLGMTPSAFRAGGPGVPITYAIGRSPLGHLLVARTEKGVCAIRLGETEAELLASLRSTFPKARIEHDPMELSPILEKILAFLDEPAAGLDLPLDIRGTAFQRRVWQALRAIPAGVTASYQEIAKAIGSPKAVRAVAGACASNPVALAVPCHRVVRANGELGGYRWGTERKAQLLAREKVRKYEDYG